MTPIDSRGMLLPGVFHCRPRVVLFQVPHRDRFPAALPVRLEIDHHDRIAFTKQFARSGKH